MSNLIKIIIADDHLLFIDGLASLLNGEKDITIENIANDGKELLELLAKEQPHIILLDINMPAMNGLEALKYIKQLWPAIRVIMLSTYSEEHLIGKAKKNGANGYLLKNCTKEELLQTIRLVMNNQTSFSCMHPKEENIFDKEDNFLRQFNLTKREIEIIFLLRTNFTNQQMADKLFLSIYTIETHRKNIMQKLGLKTPTALMKFIIEKNL